MAPSTTVVAVPASFSSTCPCSNTSPLHDLFNIVANSNNAGPPTSSSSCLEIALQSRSPSSTTTETPLASCIEDPTLFGLGCSAHWKSIIPSSGLDHNHDVLLSSMPWCFVEDPLCENVDDIIDFEITSTNRKGSFAISYSACDDVDAKTDEDQSDATVSDKNNQNTKRLRHGHSHDDKKTATQTQPNRRYDDFAKHFSDANLGWEFAGPTTYVSKFGPDPKLSSAGAVQNVVQGIEGTWFMSSVNGGIWRTTSLNQEIPHWENVLDGQPVTCSSMSALHVSKSNPNRIYAGCGGSTSSEQGSDWNVVNSGDWGGIMTSFDGGDTWQMIDSFPSNYYITDILEIVSSGSSSDSATRTLLVSAQSHLYDRDDGGIWQSIDGGISFHKVDDTPTFTLELLEYPAIVMATHARSSQHSISRSVDGGKTFADFGRLPWDEDADPFYTCAKMLGNGQIVFAALTRLGPFPNNTNSQFFISGDPSSPWERFDQPMSMDQDSMPKDRMALLADPELDDLLYVAGNAGALAWRVNVTTGTWTKMWDKPDVFDGSIPHGDCRNYAWDSLGERLLLVTDGGIFAREKPREPGGYWVSLNGDYSSLELLSAHYDPQNDRYVAGAQDNCAVVTKMNASSSDVAIGFVEGDGTVTLVDSTSSPSRLFGTTQFLGVGTIEIDPDSKGMSNEEDQDDDDGDDDDDDDDDDDCGGLCFVQGDEFIEIPLDKYFPEPSSFPFFVQPYALNRQDPRLLHIWTNGTGPERPSAFYQFAIPHSVRDKDDIGAPTKLFETPPEAMIMEIVSGGYIRGVPHPDLILAISNTHLYMHTYAEEGSKWTTIERPLPVVFAEPVTLEYDSDNGSRILGPLTHARTVSFTVSPSDSEIMAVTGWPSVQDNLGDEAVYFSADAGQTWRNVTGNLREASGVCGKVRPAGVLLVDLGDNSGALLVGTSNGILVTFLNTNPAHDSGHWIRFGSLEEYPIVLTADVDYEPSTDRLVAATFGRGIYILTDAKQKLLDARDSIMADVLSIQ